MPIKFHGNYLVTLRSGNSRSRERCQKLTVRELAENEAVQLSSASSKTAATHRITFYDFGCKRIIESRIKVDETDKLVFQVGDKDYELSSYKPARPET